MHQLLLRWSFALAAMLVAASAFAVDSCKLPRPPEESGIHKSDGLYYFVFPRVIAPSFTGCQTMWDEKGRKVFVLEFESGEPSRFRLPNSPGASAGLTCRYQGEKAAADNPEHCPAFDEVKDGIRSVADGEVPPPPGDRDPRHPSPNHSN
jgi:hypothetical protein